MRREFLHGLQAASLALLAASVPAAAAAAAAKAGATSKVPAATATVSSAAAAAAPAAPAASGGDGMTLRGDQSGTALRSLTIEGEDRVHFEIERPSLDLALDPASAPGLDWGSAMDVLDRTVPDPVAPFLRGSTAELSPYLGRPWLRTFAAGDVVRFTPQVDNVENWRLTVANSRGQTTRTFEGRGKPPREITWDGRGADGQIVPLGLRYSYVLEARDRAGNKRNFVGPGFELPAYRLAGAQGPVLAFVAGRADNGAPAPLPAPNSAVVLECASWLNQAPPARPVRITATARSYEQANVLAQTLARALAPQILGDPARLQLQARVEPDLLGAGSVQIAAQP